VIYTRGFMFAGWWLARRDFSFTVCARV